MPRKSLYTAYLQVKMTERDKEILEASALERSITAAELLRQFIRTLDKSKQGD